MKVLVTGASGMVGRILFRKLQNGGGRQFLLIDNLAIYKMKKNVLMLLKNQSLMQ